MGHPCGDKLRASRTACLLCSQGPSAGRARSQPDTRLVSVFGGSFLVAEPLGRGGCTQEFSRRELTIAAIRRPAYEAAHRRGEGAAASGRDERHCRSIVDAVLLMLDQMASAKGKPAEVVERLQAVRQRWRRSASALARIRKAQRSRTNAAPPVMERLCSAEHAAALLSRRAQPASRATTYAAAFWCSCPNGGSAGKRTPGTTPGGTPRTPKDVQLSSRRWGCAGS